MGILIVFANGVLSNDKHLKMGKQNAIVIVAKNCSSSLDASYAENRHQLFLFLHFLQSEFRFTDDDDTSKKDCT